LETVKLLMKVFNAERLLSFTEFQHVWMYLWDRLNVFRRFELGSADSIGGNHLAEALQSSEAGAGYGLSSSTMALMQNRYATEYSHDGRQTSRLSFDRFLQASLLLRLVTTSFKSVDGDGDGMVEVSFDQVMMLVLNTL